MSNLSINMTSISSAQICFTADRKGDYLIAGNSTTHTINITDGHFLRRIQGELFRLKKCQYDGYVAVKLGDEPRMKMDNSLWVDIADALFAFVLNVNFSKVESLIQAA